MIRGKRRGYFALFNYRALGQTIRELRIRRGLSQDVLSGLAGLARTHLTMIESGTVHANIETVWRIAAALEIKPSELFAMVEERAPQQE